MARKKTETPEEQPLPHLLVPREEAKAKLEQQVQRGEEIRTSDVHSMADLQTAQEKEKRWRDYTEELLRRTFSTAQLAEEFGRFFGCAVAMNPTPAEELSDFREDMDDAINRVRSIIDRLELIPEVSSVVSPAGDVVSRDVFIVHGHDQAARESVARFVTQLGLNPIILHEQPNKGRTIIEKLEGHLRVGFAIVILTPDDVGAEAEEAENLSPRARQNVVLELGFFCGVLGRSHVCALNKGNIQIPSDYLGVVYIDIDERGGWRIELAREMKAANLPVDLNKAI